jgi:hypothetical protein
MKLTRVLVENFKGVEHFEIDFVTTGDAAPRHITALLGDNGTGKTTVLQAIALTLSMATRRTRSPDQLNWHGFLAERVSSLGPTRVELDVSFDQEEIQTTALLFDEWYASLSQDWRESHRIVPPARLSKVQLRFDGRRLDSPQGFEAVNQFCGRYYVKVSSRPHQERRKLFPKLGDIFWFDQYRNLGTVGTEDGGGKAVAESWQIGVERLRQYLVGWWAYHTSPNKTHGTDYIVPLQELFARVFPGTAFHGLAPRSDDMPPGAEDWYFLLQRGSNLFDLAEMSSGEQAVFPLLYEFVRLDISKSIVLIDELGLHLHPPEQQALLHALPQIGADCQFVVTTHSEALAEAIPEEHKAHLEGGRRCL